MQTIFCPWQRPTQDHQNKISFQIPEKVTRVANFDTTSGIWKLQWWRPTQDHPTGTKLKQKMNPDWLFSFQSRVYNIHARTPSNFEKLCKIGSGSKTLEGILLVRAQHWFQNETV